MQARVGADVTEDFRPTRARALAFGAAVLCLVGAGLLLWSHAGDAVFSDLVLSALAWCF